MNNHSTHLIRNFPSKERSELVRLEDGMIIAARQKTGVVFGEDPNINQGTRMFMDATYAQAFLRKLADIDINSGLKDGEARRVAHLEETDGDRRVLTPLN